MGRYDVYANPHAAERRHTPFVLDVQNDYILALDSRVVIPLRVRSVMSRPSEVLNPELDVAGKTVVADTASLAPVPAAMLRNPVTRLNSSSHLIADALDALFGSY